MSDGHPQSALRQWRNHMGHPATLIVLLGVATVLGVAGPFGTDERLNLLQRLAYWCVTVCATYALGVLCDAAVRGAFSRSGFAVQLALSAVLTGISICAAVFIINLIVFGWVMDGVALTSFVASTFVIAAIVTIVLGVVRQHGQSTPQVVAPAPPKLLSRLPLEKRAALVALSVEDHYVRVQTLKGEELVLMRLSDAIGEVGDTLGGQVHRSHWAAFGQITSARRAGDRALLTMTTGAEIPVSRANIAMIKEAGLLPERNG